MSGGWTGKEKILKGKTQVLSGAYTTSPISEEFTLTHGGAAKALRVDLSVANSSTPSGYSAILQIRVNGVWTSVAKTVSLTGNGNFTILMHENTDTAILPFTDTARIVVTATSGALDITSIKVYQEL